jgi:hypothetical protein
MLDNKYYIKTIDNKTANTFQKPIHYLHRTVNGVYTFGMIEKQTEELKGVIIYGMGNSPTLRAGICGEEEGKRVIELSRLCISPTVEKNAASWLIAHSMKYVNHEIIVSFADPTHGHFGGVYQATNWIYTGLSTKRKNYKVKGLNITNKGVTARYSLQELKAMGDNFTSEDRPRKHRYVYFNCNKRRQKELINKLKYPIQPYPKKLNYETSIVYA